MDTPSFVAKAAEKCGFNREKYDDQTLPTDPNNIALFPFFGDMRSIFVLSSLLLNRLKEERPSKYFILATWPGLQGLFPYMDEVWGLNDETILKQFYSSASQFRNKSDSVNSYCRGFNQWIEDVIPLDYFAAYYSSGIQNGFWQQYKCVKRTLPLIPSTIHLSKDLIKDLTARGGFKIFIYPALFMTHWRLGDVEQVPVAKEFWISLLRRLIHEKFVPVVYKCSLTHDISADLTNKCVYVADLDIAKVLAAMRFTGCVLDLFTGISRLAIAARCPFLMVDERARYVALKEYEIDDLCGPSLPKQYIFSFPTIIGSGNQDVWDFNILNNVMTRLHAFLPTLDRDVWPSTGESTEIVSYEIVRKRKHKRIGIKLLKAPRD